MLNMDVFQKLAMQTAKYPPEIGVMYTILGLVGESGELANKAKKLVRLGKDLENLTEREKAILLDELGDVLWYCAALADQLNYPLSYPAVANIRKLGVREEQGDLLSMEHGQGGPES